MRQIKSIVLKLFHIKIPFFSWHAQFASHNTYIWYGILLCFIDVYCKLLPFLTARSYRRAIILITPRTQMKQKLEILYAFRSIKINKFECIFPICMSKTSNTVIESFECRLSRSHRHIQDNNEQCSKYCCICQFIRRNMV